MTSRRVRRTQSAPHLSGEKRRVHLAVVEGTLYIRKRNATSYDNGLIQEEDEAAKNKEFGSSIESVSSLASEGSSACSQTRERHMRVVHINSAPGSKTGLRINKAYNSQSSISEDLEDSLAASEAFRRRERRKDFNKRHTLVGIENVEDLENLHFQPQRRSSPKVRESPLIMDYLKRKYPEHTDRIDGKPLPVGSPVSNGFYETDLDNLDTMSEIDTESTGFRRGGRLRSSLPVVGPVVNKTKERPLGLIYLQYKNETKRALMPNEVTGIDTVRALYVRAFPKQLNMYMLEQPARKIYIKDSATEIFYELENVNDVHDRTVLKIYEPGFVEDPNAQGPSSPRSTASTPVELDYYSEPEVDHQKRDVRKNRYHTMTLPRNMQYTQEGGSSGQRPANLNPSLDKGGGRQPPPPDNFRRGTPERASATIPRPSAHNQAFQRLTPERASVGGPVMRGPSSAPQGRRGPPPPRREGSATMPRRLTQDGSWDGGQRPRNSATMPRQKVGMTAVDDGGFSALRPSGGDMQRSADNTQSSKSQPLHEPIKYSMQVQTSAMPDQNGRPQQQRGPHPQQTPPGRPQNQGTLPRNGAPGMRHPIPNGTGLPSQRGPGPLRRHGSHEGPLQGRPHSAPSVEGAVSPLQGVHPGAQRPYSQPATRTPVRPPSVEEDTNERIMAMEQQIANLAGMVRSVIGPRNGTPRQAPVTQRDGQRPTGDPRQPTPRRESPMVRADSAPLQTRPQGPQQMRSPAPQQTRPPGPQQSRPPGPQPARPHHPGSVNLQRSAMVLKHRTTDMRMQLKQIRKMHLNMVQQMNNNFRSTSHKIRVALEAVPGSDKHPIRNQRGRVHQDYIRYKQAQDKIERDLRELDQNVERVRDQTINNRGSIDIEKIDHLAQALGNSSRRIAEQKVAFPVLAEKLKAVQEGEMEIVVREESWMKHEPQRLDDYLKRSKKITSTLYTLKRMAATQNEPYATPPTAATVTFSNVDPPKQVVRMESTPLPEPMVVKQENIDTNQVPEVRHKLPRRFNSSEEREAFEHQLADQREELKKTSNINASSTRHRRNLRELYDQENHDAMTPIITPEKAAKKEAQKEAAAAQKKGPPPPPPPRKHFPVLPPAEQSDKKITWSTMETKPNKPKVPNDVESMTESVAESVVESVPESVSAETDECDEVKGTDGEGAARLLSNTSSSSVDCLVHTVTIDPPQILSTVKSQETSKSSPSLGVSDDIPTDLNGSFQSETLGQVGNGGVAHSNGLVGKDTSNSSKTQVKKTSLFLSKSSTNPSKSGQQGSSGGKSKSKKMGGALARLLRRDSGKNENAHKNGSTSSNTGPPPKPPRGCLDSPTQQTKKLFVGADGKPAKTGSNSNNNAKPIAISQRGQKQVTQHSRMTKSAENISLSSSPEPDMSPPQGIYNVQQQQIIQDTHAAGSTILRNTMSVTLSSPTKTVSESANMLDQSPKLAPSSVECELRETDPAVRPKRQSSFGTDDPKTIQLKAQYAKLRQMQIDKNSSSKEKPAASGGHDAAQKENRHEISPQPSAVTALVGKHDPDQVPSHHEMGCMQNGTSPQLNEKAKVKSAPPPVAAKPQSLTKTTKTTTTTTSKRSYQIEDVNQALDELENLAFKATETTDFGAEDSNIIKDSSPSSPNGAIQKPVHAQIRLQQSPSRNFATKPKPVSPKGGSSISKVGGKSSAFTPVKVTSIAVNKSDASSPMLTTSSPASSSASLPTGKQKVVAVEKEAADETKENNQKVVDLNVNENSDTTVTITVTETVIQTETIPEHITNNNGQSGTNKDRELLSNRVGEIAPQESKVTTTNENGTASTEGGIQGNDHTANEGGVNVVSKNGNGQLTSEGGVKITGEGGDKNTDQTRDLITTGVDENEKYTAIPKGAYIAEVKTIIVNGVIEETFIN